MTTESIKEASEAPLVPDAAQTAQPGDAHAKRPADNTSVSEPADKIEPEAAQTAQPGDAHANRPADQHIGESVAAFKAAIESINPVKLNLTESMTGLLTNAGLTEEFGTQAIEIFEAAVSEVAKEYIASIAEAAEQVFESAVTAQAAEMEAAVEATVAEAVTEWMVENRIALEESAKAANNNNLVESMIQLIESHGYVVNTTETPVSESVVDESVQEDEVLAEQVSVLVEDNNKLRKALMVSHYTRNLSELQAEKITSLAESLEFADEESFAAKLSVLSEHFVNTKTAKLTDEGLDTIVEDEPAAAPSADPYINAMVSTIGKYIQK